MSLYRDPFSTRAEEIARQAILRADGLGMEHYGPAPTPLEDLREKLASAGGDNNEGGHDERKKPRTSRKTPGRHVRETEQGEHPGNVGRLEICITRRVAKAGLGFLFMNLSDLSQKEA